MAPVAVSTNAPRGSFSTPSPKGMDKIDIARRPSPWHNIAHSLSEAPSPGPGHSPSPRRSSFPVPSPPVTPSTTPPLSTSHTPLSSSQALRDWEALLSHPSSDAKRHQLVHTPSYPPSSDGSFAGSFGVPKLAAERDKDGHIEYKLKLIDPTPERFERLVTQMMWRLKQGRNEAIYEIGLADDGTVIGLTRPEMDASLRTLELMASEVGATVIVLKEIVLTGSASNLPRSSPSPALSASAVSVSSSALSVSSGHSPTTGGWLVRRPDLDEHGFPRKGTRGVINADGERVISRRDKAREKWLANGGEEAIKEKQVIFTATDLGVDQVDDESPNVGPVPVPSPRRRRESSKSSATDEDIPPFHLDLDLEETSPSPTTSETPGWHRGKRSGQSSRASPSQDDLAEQSKKARAKAAKSAAKREQRRLDLLRGDGTSPVWVEMSESLPPMSWSPPSPQHAPVLPRVSPRPSPSSTQIHPHTHHIPVLPHQPARPSSLRLASPAESPDDSFLNELLHLPLDNLSLSFADVQTVTDPASALSTPNDVTPSSPSTDTEYAHPLGDIDDDAVEVLLPGEVGRMGSGSRYVPPPPGEEMICVEALVVRKVMEEQWCGEDDGWGLGGDDDGWDFGERENDEGFEF